jgi:EAL and modified HD-GYP domain-containing signal transduction protein
MRVFVARQPIFDGRQRVVAYELLFRSGEANRYDPGVDGDLATARLLDGGLHTFGLEHLAGRAPVFINFTRSLLVGGTAALLPPSRAVVEVLETVEPDDEVLAACRSLKRQGYSLALDDFVFRPGHEPFVALADFVKVDFLATPPGDRRRYPALLRPRGLRLVAEKVEAAETFREAAALGYDMFQGYFFARPEMVSRKDVPAHKLNCLRLLKELHEPGCNLDRLERILKRDVSLTLKLLRYVNSAWFGLRSPVRSLRQALALLGEKGVRRWASLVLLSNVASDRPPELLTISLIRAHLCASLAEPAGLTGEEEHLFLAGLFSALDALLGRPLEEVLAEVRAAPEVCRALLAPSNHLHAVFRLALAYTEARWDEVAKTADWLRLDPTLLPELYLRALRWADPATEALG